MKPLPVYFIAVLLLCFAVKAQKPLSGKPRIKIPDSLLLPKAALPPIPQLPGDEAMRQGGEDESKLIDYVETEATPDRKVWNNYLRKGLQPCVDSAVKKGLPPALTPCK